MRREGGPRTPVVVGGDHTKPVHSCRGPEGSHERHGRGHRTDEGVGSPQVHHGAEANDNRPYGHHNNPVAAEAGGTARGSHFCSHSPGEGCNHRVGVHVGSHPPDGADRDAGETATELDHLSGYRAGAIRS